MIVHLYTFGWNEMRMLGFLFRHYEPWVQKFTFFDDGSTDGTLDLLRAKANVEVRQLAYPFPESLSLSVQALRNQCWKESRGEADWVIVTDVDEHIHHPRLTTYLADCKRRGVTYMPALGFDMVTESFPEPYEHLAQTRTLGAPNANYSKLRIFDPNAIDETNFGVGAHRAAPSGRLVLPKRDELLLLHYKELGTDYVKSRHAGLGPRLRTLDLERRWGNHYFFDDTESAIKRSALTQRLVDIADPAYRPWRDHKQPRWWRREFRRAVRRALRSARRKIRQRFQA